MRFKHLVKRLFSPFTLRIRAGALQGRRWIVTSGSRFLKGTYEPLQSQSFQQLLQPGEIVFDVGAHVGYYTVLSSVLVGPSGRVISFEPVAANLAYLRRHVLINECDNVSILPICVGDRAGTAQFNDSEGTGVGHLDDDGSLEVQVRPLDELIGSGELPVPQFIKIDVEGAEMQVLRGAEQLLSQHHPSLILSTHGDELDATCWSWLRDRGYDLDHLEPDVIVARKRIAQESPRRQFAAA